jgi:methionyl-tRNA formyltransferase
MRAVLCTSGGLPGAAVLDALQSSDKIQVVGIVRSTRVLSARYRFLRGAWEQYRRSGLRYTAYLGCTLLKPLPRRGVPALATRNVNDASGRELIAQLAPELIVSAFFNQRIGAAVTALAPSVNIHPSLLPAFKGVDPVFYARLRGAPLGVTLHRISPDLDAGPILAQQASAALEGESVLAATVRLYALGARLLIDSLERVRSQGTKQAAAGNYDSWPRRGEVAALRRKGVRLVRLRDLLARAP